MLLSISSEALRRLRTVRDTVRAIDAAEKSNAADDASRAAKGLIFVQLYATYEFVVDSTVRALCDAVNKRALPKSAAHSGVLALALDPDFMALKNMALENSWARRHELLQCTRELGPVSIRDGLFPGDGSQFRASQLEMIWRLFSLPGAPIPEPRWRGRIEEMVEKRNAVAHGREAATTVGGGFSVGDLQVRVDDTEALCTHILQSATALIGAPRAFESELAPPP